MAEPIDLPLGLWARVGQKKHKFNCTCQVAPTPMWRHSGRAHWRHLANTIEPSVCGGDAASCQITLNTWRVRWTVENDHSVETCVDESRSAL